MSDFLITDEGLLPLMNSSQAPSIHVPLPDTQLDVTAIDGAADTTAGMAADVALQQVPPPFLRRWFLLDYSAHAARQTTLCYSYEIPLGTNAPVRAMQGFNVTLDPDTKKKKPGLISWEAGGSVAMPWLWSSSSELSTWKGNALVHCPVSRCQECF